MGGRINIFPGMKPLKTSYMHVAQAGRAKRPFTLFCARSIFVNDNKLFYIFASSKQIWITKYTRFVEVTVESDRGCKKTNKQTNKQNKTKQLVG